jgi:hypothetical protein
MTLLQKTKDLHELYEQQDTTIEHKLPLYNGDIPCFVEAAGDIYRELTQETVDFGGYIGEKRMKLRKFFELNEQRIKDIQDTPKNYPDWYEKLEDYLMTVDDLSSETSNFKFGNYEKVNVYGTKVLLDRKELMIAILEVISAICLYAEGEFTKEQTERVIRYADALFNVKTN